jgi:hypothetical protein
MCQGRVRRNLLLNVEVAGLGSYQLPCGTRKIATTDALRNRRAGGSRSYPFYKSQRLLGTPAESGLDCFKLRDTCLASSMIGQRQAAPQNTRGVMSSTHSRRTHALRSIKLRILDLERNHCTDCCKMLAAPPGAHAAKIRTLKAHCSTWNTSLMQSHRRHDGRGLCLRQESEEATSAAARTSLKPCGCSRIQRSVEDLGMVVAISTNANVNPSRIVPESSRHHDVAAGGIWFIII